MEASTKIKSLKSSHSKSILYRRLDIIEFLFWFMYKILMKIPCILEEILSNYRVLNYNGALDIICHYPGTEEMYSRTQWPGRKMFLQSHRSFASLNF